MIYPPDTWLSEFREGETLTYEGNSFVKSNNKWISKDEAVNGVVNSNASSADKLNAISGILNGSANVFNSLGLGGLISGAGNRPDAQLADDPQQKTASTSNNTMLYIGLGVLVLLVGFLMFKKKQA